MTEEALDTPAIDIQTFQNVDHFLDIVVIVDGPGQNVEVFQARLQHRKNDVQKFGVLELTLKEPEIIVVELDPEDTSLKMLKPFGAKESVPVFMNPRAEGVFA